MTPAQAFQFVEEQLLDCPRARLRIVGAFTGKEFTVHEVYESELELVITIDENEHDNK